jgi:hypothetical protein
MGIVLSRPLSALLARVFNLTVMLSFHVLLTKCLYINQEKKKGLCYHSLYIIVCLLEYG